MRYFVIAFLFLLYSAGNAFSQADSGLFQMEWGKEYKKSEFKNYQRVGGTKGEFIFLRKAKNVHFFERMAPDGTKLQSEIITCRKFRKFYKKIEGAYVEDNFILMHSYVFDSHNNKVFTIVDLFDSKTFAFIKNISVDSVRASSDKVDMRFTEYPRALMNVTSADAYTNERGEKKIGVVVFQCRLKEFVPAKRLNIIRYNPIVVRYYDANWNLEKEVDLRKILDYKLSDEVINCVLDSFGNAWCNYKKYLEDKVPRWPSVKPYQLGLVSIKNDGKSIDNVLTDFNSDLVTQSVEFVTRENKFLMCGYYSEKNLQSAEGCFSISIDLNSPQKIIQITYPFSKEFVEGRGDGISIPNGSKSMEGDKGIEELRLEIAYELKDEVLVVVGRQLPSFDAKREEFIVTKFNSDGELIWNKKMPVKFDSQKFEMDYACAFNQCGESMILIYNTYPVQDGNALIGYSINPDGTGQNEIIQLSAKNEMTIPLYWSTWLSDCSRAFVARKKKTVQFGLLKMH